METASSSDAIEPLPFISAENGKDNLDESQPRLTNLKSRFYELYGEYFTLKAENTIWRDTNINNMLVDGKNTIKALTSDLNIHDFKPIVPYFEQKRVISEESLNRAERELIIFGDINSRIRKRLEELDQLYSFSI